MFYILLYLFILLFQWGSERAATTHGRHQPPAVRFDSRWRRWWGGDGRRASPELAAGADGHGAVRPHAGRGGRLLCRVGKEGAEALGVLSSARWL